MEFKMAFHDPLEDGELVYAPLEPCQWERLFLVWQDFKDDAALPVIHW